MQPAGHYVSIFSFNLFDVPNPIGGFLYGGLIGRVWRRWGSSARFEGQDRNKNGS
jgi:hypothetical protein